MANDSIFQFADKFGIESPFGDWLKKNRQDTEKPAIVSVNAYLDTNAIHLNNGTISTKKDKNDRVLSQSGYYRYKGNVIVPIVLVVKFKGYPTKIEVEDNDNKLLKTFTFGTNSYRISYKVIQKAPYAYQDVTFKIGLFGQHLLKQEEKDNSLQYKVSDAQVFTVRVFSDGRIANKNLKEDKDKQCQCSGDISIKTIQNISPLIRVSNIKKRIKGLNEAFDESEINTCLRRAHFLAQVLHETGYLRLTAEAGRTDANYKGFKGRGLIQLTFYENYKGYQDFSGVDVTSSTANKQKLEKYPHAARASAWYWNKKENLNWYADQNDFIMITRRINGGFNGWDDRMKFLKGAVEELTKYCDEEINTDYRLSGSNAYYDVFTSFAWALWHDPELNKGKNITKNRKKAINGYQRVVELAKNETNYSGIENMKAFSSIQYVTKGRNTVDVKDAAELRLKQLK